MRKIFQSTLHSSEIQNPKLIHAILNFPPIECPGLPEYSMGETSRIAWWNGKIEKTFLGYVVKYENFETFMSK